ncbi:hypothetical protein [Bacillus mobilis]|uniref:hypothetical protein n=1 Tax=Bacillus mobilis TaxID=2026190 RepID=UPI0036780875
MRVNRYKQWARYHFKGATGKYKKYIRDWKEYNTPNNRPPSESTVGYLDPTFKWERGLNAGNTITNIIFFRRKNGKLTVQLAKESTKSLMKKGWIK